MAFLNQVVVNLFPRLEMLHSLLYDVCKSTKAGI